MDIQHKFIKEFGFPNEIINAKDIPSKTYICNKCDNEKTPEFGLPEKCECGSIGWTAKLIEE